MLSVGFLPPPKGCFCLSSTPMTVYRPVSMLTSLPMAFCFAEEFLPRVVSEDHDVLAALILRVGPEAALKEGEVGDESDLGSGALQNGAGNLFAVVLHADIADAELRLDVLIAAIGGDHMGQRAQREDVVDVELFAGEHFGGGPHADDRHVKDPEDIAARVN